MAAEKSEKEKNKRNCLVVCRQPLSALYSDRRATTFAYQRRRLFSTKSANCVWERRHLQFRVSSAFIKCKLHGEWVGVNKEDAGNEVCNFERPHFGVLHKASDFFILSLHAFINLASTTNISQTDLYSRTLTACDIAPKSWTNFDIHLSHLWLRIQFWATSPEAMTVTK